MSKRAGTLVAGWIVVAMLGASFIFTSAPVVASNGSFFGPHSDRGLDADGNNRFEHLQVNATVVVTESGDFTIEGILNDSAGSTFITNVTRPFSAPTTGGYVVDLEFNGSHIFESAIDGPYNVTLRLFNATMEFNDEDFHMTSSYSYLDFAPTIAFTPPHTDWGMDTDANGDYNFLQVNVSVNTSEPGFYTIFGILSGTGGPIGMKIRLFNLTAGDHIVKLNFSGIGAYISGEDDPYTVQLLASGLLFGGPPEFPDMDFYTTGAYFFTDFEAGTKRYLLVNVTNTITSQPVVGQSVWLANQTHRWAIQMETDANGTANFTAFEGDFVLMAQAEEEGLQGVTQSLTIAGNTQVQVDLGVAPPSDNIINLTMTTWDSVDLDFQGSMYQGNQSQRFMIDQFVGDGDLTVDQQEADVWLEIFSAFIPALNDTTGQFEVDDIAFELVDGTLSLDFQIVGDVTSTEPFIITQVGSFTSQGVIPVRDPHKVMFNVTYDNENETQVASLTFPSGWVLLDYQAPVNITVSGVDSNTATIDPLPQPMGEPEAVDVILNVTADTTPPSVTSATVSPDPGEANFNVEITADITENSGIASVKVNISDPSGTPVGNFTMSPVDADTYTYVASFNQLGVYNFTVWVTDDAGLVGSATGSFNIQDTTRPVFGTPSVSPSPAESGAAVDFSVQVSDNYQIDQVSIVIEDPVGTELGNFTMALVGGEYTYSSSFGELGVYTYTIWASDPSGNIASAGGTFTVQDTTPPALGAPSAAPSPQEVGLGVDFSVVVTDNHMLDNVTIEIRDPDGGLIGNFTMSLVGGEYTYSSSFGELGTYTYTIWASDVSGNYRSSAGEFTVEDTTAPVAAASGLATADVGEDVSVTGSGSTDNHRIVNYTWDFGDGAIGYGATASHAYDAPGQYTITLTVRDEAGNEATDSFTITIGEVPTPGLPISDVVLYAIIGVIAAAGVVVVVVIFLRRTK